MGCQLPPVTAGIGVWLDGVGQAGMYRTAERMSGRTRVIPLTHAPETGARNRRQKTGVGFWSVCHTIWRQIFLAPDSGVG